MKRMSGRTLRVLQEAWGRDGTVESLLYTDRPPTERELEALSESGCTLCSQSASTVHLVRFRARDVHGIVNLGFVEGVEALER